MRICVVGAGAIGGYLAVRLANSGHDVSVVLRGANLNAAQQNGLKLVHADGREEVARVAATSRPEDLSGQDVVILGMKAHQVAPVAPAIPLMLAPEGFVVTAQNGVPWWYFLGAGGEFDGKRLEAVDPDGAVSSHIDYRRVIGSVVYPACEMQAPGVIRHIEGNRFTLGEIDGSDSPRIRALSEAFRKAGFKAPISTDIRSEIWLKLWGNVTFNPMSALTHATLAGMCEFPPTRHVAVQMMGEAKCVADRLGVSLRVSLEQRLQGAAAVGEHKTSMLQDLEAGRPLELEALVATVIELGRIVGVPTPTISNIYAMTALLARTVVQKGGRLRIEPA